jgi:hypothetical protein
MSPAEITQQLGLQSLTRRAWVSLISSPIISAPLIFPFPTPGGGLGVHVANSPSPLPVHPIYLRHHW